MRHHQRTGWQLVLGAIRNIMYKEMELAERIEENVRNPPQQEVYIADAFMPWLFENHRYKVAYGGRGGAKSWQFARALIAKAYTQKRKVLCAREYQSSIADSVHATLVGQIRLMGLEKLFDITKTNIRSRHTGSEFIFKGLHHNIQEIKSIEDIDDCWVEEAEAVSEESWEILLPTIRNDGSEFYISFNPVEADSPTYKRFVLDPPPDASVHKVGWKDNPWFPAELDKLRRFMERTDPDAYAHVWEGACRTVSEATIFRNRYSVETFETPPEVDRFFFGADWGFANDPTVLIRCWIRDNYLYVDQEAYGVGIEIDDLPALFAGGRAEKNSSEWPGVPGARDWPIYADCARPETISYVRRRGFSISPADKWSGSVEDGIAHLKGFEKIIIHERCRNMATEARLYSYKTDPKTNAVFPVIVDAHNHCWDALRYALNGFIQKRGGLGVWDRLVS